MATVSRSSLHCGGYYIVTTVDNTCTIKLLDPKDGSTDLLPRKLNHARRSSTGSSEVFSVNHPVQNSEFLSSDDPASNDSSTQKRSSTGSSEVFSINHPVQNSEFLLNYDPASNDSSKLQPVSTGSSEVLTFYHLLELFQTNGL